MNQSMIVAPYLAKATADLKDATASLALVWRGDSVDAINDIVQASEALGRAISWVALAVDRLSELVVD